MNNSEFKTFEISNGFFPDLLDFKSKKATGKYRYTSKNGDFYTGSGIFDFSPMSMQVSIQYWPKVEPIKLPIFFHNV